MIKHAVLLARACHHANKLFKKWRYYTKCTKHGCDEQQLRQPAPPSIATSKMGVRTFKNSFDKYGACTACTSPQYFVLPDKIVIPHTDCQLLVIR